MRSLHLSHCLVRHCSLSLALSWLRSGSRVVNEQRLTVCIIGAVYRERLPLAAGSWHTLHLPPAKAEWNHTQGGRTERTSSTGLVITFKYTSQREKGVRLRRFFHLILGKSRGLNSRGCISVVTQLKQKTKSTDEMNISVCEWTLLMTCL